MRKFVTDGDGLPKWSSPISHAVVVDNICYLSGYLSIGPAGEYVPGTIRCEAERAFGNLFAAIRAAEFSIEDLTFVDIALIDIGDVPEVNRLYAELFPEGRRPARTIYQAAALPFGGKVKVVGVAIKERSIG
jgi:enamine deaminase RidA (YjgF/YER057c/UK114 family)